MVLLSNWEMEGYLGDFQCNSMKRLASKDVKATVSFCTDFSAIEGSGIPNIAIRGQLFRFTLRTADIIVKELVQKVLRSGQRKNIWLRCQGEPWHLSHLPSTS